MSKTSLLEKALAVQKKHIARENITEEQMELAIGWLTGLVTMTQVSKALGEKSTGGTYCQLAQFLRAAYDTGILKVKQ